METSCIVTDSRNTFSWSTIMHIIPGIIRLCLEFGSTLYTAGTVHTVLYHNCTVPSVPVPVSPRTHRRSLVGELMNNGKLQILVLGGGGSYMEIENIGLIMCCHWLARSREVCR